MDQRLFEAARMGDIATLELLLQEDPLLLDRLNQSSIENPLHVSAFSGQAAFAAEILRLKPGLAKELNNQGLSPLHIASASGELGVVREILRVGKRDLCLVKGKDGLLPLHCAAQRGRSEIIKELVYFCSDSLKAVTVASLETPLHVAVKNNQVESTKALLEEMNNHDMSEIANWPDREGNTVLHLATLGKHLELVEMLIGEQPKTFRVNPNISNGRGLTPKDILDLVLETEGSGNISEMYKFVQIFQKAEAINGKQASIITEPNISSRPASARFPKKLWNLLDWEIQNIKDHERDALLVVAVLIATITYQGIAAPPGSFKTEENGEPAPVGKKSLKAGEAIMANNRTAFTLYAVFNTVGFLASVAMISLLTKRFPLRNWLRLCIISMLSNYIIAILYISPAKNEGAPVYIALALCALLVLREIVLFTMSLSKIVSKIKQDHYS